MTVFSRPDGAAAQRFPAGTFAPDPRPASAGQMLAAQIRMELVLLLRHGEQLLLTMFIPVALLVGLTLLPLGDLAEPRIDHVFPAVLMTAVMSTGFTGQAIAVGFDRRYGALKRIGATALPRWGIVAGKSGAVAIVVAMQCVLLGTIALALGWRPSVTDLLLGLVVVALGTVMFTTLGLLLGGTLKAEVVLALANLVWFVLLGIGSVVLVRHDIPGALVAIAELTPSGAMALALDDAFAGAVRWSAIAVTAVWAAVGGAAATRWFRFT